MPDLPQNILSQLVNLPHAPKLEQAFIVAKDLAPGESPPWTEGGLFSGGAEQIAFQYWPETLTDSREVAWNPRVIPGGSHPIYQWTHGGERRVSFTAVFTTDTDPDGAVGIAEAAGGGAVAQGAAADDPYSTLDLVPLSGIQKGTRDMDIRQAISWLRYFTYPLYGDGEDLRVFEPPKVLLCLPSTRLGHNGTDHITALMTQCEVTYEEWFPSGFPRAAEIQLEFAETVQSGGRVRFHSRDEMQLSSALGSYTGVSSSGF